MKKSAVIAKFCSVSGNSSVSAFLTELNLGGCS